jgi:uncharacterized LabA/DUF88 family protein
MAVVGLALLYPARLLTDFENRGTLARAFYYTAVMEDQEYSSIRPLIDWLGYNGYTVVTKATATGIPTAIQDPKRTWTPNARPNRLS